MSSPAPAVLLQVHEPLHALALASLRAAVFVAAVVFGLAAVAAVAVRFAILVVAPNRFGPRRSVEPMVVRVERD